MHTMLCVWRPENSLEESVLSFYHVEIKYRGLDLVAKNLFIC